MQCMKKISLTACTFRVWVSSTALEIPLYHQYPRTGFPAGAAAPQSMDNCFTNAASSCRHFYGSEGVKPLNKFAQFKVLHRRRPCEEFSYPH